MPTPGDDAPGDIVSGDERSLRQIHEEDVARFLASEETVRYVPTHVFATISGRVVGMPEGAVEVACKPGKLSGNDPWETTVTTRDISVLAIRAVRWQMYPGEPSNWSGIKGATNGAFKVTVEEPCDTATLFIRTPDQRVVTMTVTG